MAALEAWDSFYVIVGASAGALIGLQFVLMTLIAERPQPGIVQVGRAFGTPTVVHFSTTLTLGALVRTPWPDAVYAVWTSAAVGLFGLTFMAMTVTRMWNQKVYRPDLEDLAFHVVLPLLAYGVLVGCVALAHVELALFGIGGSALLLLLVGIHNAWDAVDYQVYVQRIRRDG
ncbi:MAG: hypothetical protein JSR60_10145 [Proteobacteria bacterium]|nr:hypothetical protein [Pseudomonadota bacterium]